MISSDSTSTRLGRKPDGLPLLIAEVGFNHEGDWELAARMAREAALAGADLVKFQTFETLDLVLPDSPHTSLIKPGEMTAEHAEHMAAVCREAGVGFFSTPFSLRAVEMLEKVGVTVYKVASMDLTNLPLLGEIARTGKPMVVSTGMASLAEIATAVEHLHACGASEVALLHCIAKYPAAAAELRLDAMDRLRAVFGLPVGYSDHFPGTKACLAAFFRGAEIIETHFTLDTSLPGGDHAHAADPELLRALVRDMRLFLEMQGEGDFFAHRPDADNARAFRRGLYAARDLSAGHVLRLEDLLQCRPAGTLTPNDLPVLLGKALAREAQRHEILSWEHFIAGDRG